MCVCVCVCVVGGGRPEEPSSGCVEGQLVLKRFLSKESRTSRRRLGGGVCVWGVCVCVWGGGVPQE